jgi:hypothetical protein
VKSILAQEIREVNPEHQFIENVNEIPLFIFLGQWQGFTTHHFFL